MDPVPIECTLELAAASHLDNKWYKPRKFATSLNYTNDGTKVRSDYERQYYDVPSDQYIRQNYTIVRHAVKPGDCIVFHMRVLHSAPGILPNLFKEECSAPDGWVSQYNTILYYNYKMSLIFFKAMTQS